MKNKYLLLSLLLINCYLFSSLMAQPYSVFQVDNEYHLMYEEFHFLSILSDNGINAYRPHPGHDVNGWGSTWYAQPFFPGAVLGHTTVDSVIANEQGIVCYTKGMVSINENDTYGNWNMSLYFEYIPELKIISGNGIYTISLDSILSIETGDLNLFKIASNYLFDVPLLCDTVQGETGDMEKAVFDGTSYADPITWIPTDSNLFVMDHTDILTIEVKGCYNNVDTYSLGFSIEPAYKPAMTITLSSVDAGLEMIVGGIYDFDLGQDFAADNVGITPLILASSQQTEFSFTVYFESIVTVAQTETPLILPENTPFTDSLEIIISCDTLETKIYYTTDECDPKITSTLYSGPFFIDTTTVIKAKAYKCGLETSNIVEKDYELQSQSIPQLHRNQNFNIYPNPFSGSLTIEFADLDAGKYKINILDVKGIFSYKTEIIHLGGQLYKEINCFGFNAGLYIIHIDDGDNSCVRRIIKSN